MKQQPKSFIMKFCMWGKKINKRHIKIKKNEVLKDIHYMTSVT